MESRDVAMTLLSSSTGIQNGTREGLFATLSSGLRNNMSENELPAWPGFESGYSPQPFIPSSSTSSFTSQSITSLNSQPTPRAATISPVLKVAVNPPVPVGPPIPNVAVSNVDAPLNISPPVSRASTSSSRYSQSKKSHCISSCRKTNMEVFMIQCDVCQVWFHGSCVHIDEDQGKDIEKYHCPTCRRTHGPLTLKNRPRWWEAGVSGGATVLPSPSLDAHATNGEIPSTPRLRNGCAEFIRRLKQRSFAGPTDLGVFCLTGEEVTFEFLSEHGFHVPILVDCKDGLDITVPASTTTAHDIEDLVGSMRELDVIDVAEQRERKMLMREWVEYYLGRDGVVDRSITLNLISLEFSATKLAELVDPPAVVKKLSWVDRFWPTERPNIDSGPIFIRPEVQKYCLMSVQDSYTDFHVDFGGSSVWYHVLRGEKIFYLIRPTPANIACFENWYLSQNQSETFFPDLIDDVCYRCVIKQGQTVFLPSGWIHAVLTPVDSLVFGGNFLHTLNIDMQLQVYAMEKRTNTPVKYYFPNFETIHWYVAEHMLEELKKFRADKERGTDNAPLYLVRGARTLLSAIQVWNRQKSQQPTVPESIYTTRLLSSFGKLVKLWDEPATANNEAGNNQVVEASWNSPSTSSGGSGGAKQRKRLKKANHFIW